MAELHEATAAAAEFFTEPRRRRIAEAYLQHRGIDPDALAPEWVIGFAPTSWTGLTEHLADGFDDATLLDAGLAFRSRRGTLIDCFRDRVIFGIHDADGQLAGFTGRDVSGNPDAPKYLNTHRNAIFDKGALLYGLHEGNETAQPVVVEGPIDVLAIAAQRADLLPVASCGTAFTDRHAQLLATSATQRGVVVALDGDPAGRSAALTTGARLRDLGMEPFVARLPEGDDPAQHLARRGGVDVLTMTSAVPLLDAEIAAVMANVDDSPWLETKIAALRAAADRLASAGPAAITAYASTLGTRLQLSPATIANELVDAVERHALEI